MLDLFIEDRLYSLLNLLQFKAFFELYSNFVTKISFDALSDVKSVYFFEEGQSHFIDAANDSDSHTLGHFSTTWKVALTSWIILLT